MTDDDKFGRHPNFDVSLEKMFTNTAVLVFY